MSDIEFRNDLTLHRVAAAFVYASCEQLGLIPTALEVVVRPWGLCSLRVMFERGAVADVEALARLWELPIDCTYDTADQGRCVRWATSGFPGNDLTRQHEDHRWTGTRALGFQHVDVDVYCFDGEGRS